MRTAPEWAASGLRRALRAPAVVNATRWAIHRVAVATGLPVEVGTAARSKWNLRQRALERRPATLAACVGATTPRVLRWAGGVVLGIRALGRGRYQRTQVDGSGFPRGHLMRGKSVHGFRSGDLARADASLRRPACEGPVVVRASARFRVGERDGVPWRACRLLQRADGYAYTTFGWGGAARPRADAAAGAA